MCVCVFSSSKALKMSRRFLSQAENLAPKDKRNRTAHFKHVRILKCGDVRAQILLF